MKLRKKETGEIGYFCFANWNDPVLIIMDKDGVQLAKYNSLAEMNAEWEDAPEEPKYFYCICTEGSINKYEVERYETETWVKHAKSIGNCFNTREEAEEAVEKLKAFKRLKDNGMIKYSFHKEKTGIDLDFYTLTILAPRDKDSLDLLFGGEE